MCVGFVAVVAIQREALAAAAFAVVVVVDDFRDAREAVEERGNLVCQVDQQFAVRRIGRIGLPLASSGLYFSAVYVALGRTLASLSPVYLAALGIGHRIEALAYPSPKFSQNFPFLFFFSSECKLRISSNLT